MSKPTAGRPISEAPKDGPFLVWHVGEWRIVRCYIDKEFPPDILPPEVWADTVICVLSGKIWGARCWWPLPPAQPGNEGKL